jgi:hypothetical protein
VAVFIADARRQVQEQCVAWDSRVGHYRYRPCDVFTSVVMKTVSHCFFLLPSWTVERSSRLMSG